MCKQAPRTSKRRKIKKSKLTSPNTQKTKKSNSRKTKKLLKDAFSGRNISRNNLHEGIIRNARSFPNALEDIDPEILKTIKLKNSEKEYKKENKELKEAISDLVEILATSNRSQEVFLKNNFPDVQAFGIASFFYNKAPKDQRVGREGLTLGDQPL